MFHSLVSAWAQHDDCPQNGTEVLKKGEQWHSKSKTHNFCPTAQILPWYQVLLSHFQMSGHISEAQINLHGHDSPKDLLAPSGKTGFVPLASSSHPHQKPDLGKSLLSLSQSFNILEVLSFSKNILPNIYFVYFIGNLKYSEIILLTFSLSLWNSALFPIFMLLTWISLYIKNNETKILSYKNLTSNKCKCGIVNIDDIQSDESHERLTRREDVVLRRPPVDWLKLRLTLQLPRLLVLQVGSKDYNRWKLQDGIFTHCTKTHQKIRRSFWELLLLKSVCSHTGAPLIGERNLPFCLELPKLTFHALLLWGLSPLALFTRPTTT